MKHLISRAALALVLCASPCAAQQNLFNIPSSEITKAGEVYIQEQVNLTPSSLQSNLTVVKGLGHGWEVGGDFFNWFPFNPGTAPSLLLNAQKVVAPRPYFQVGLGTQMGLTLPTGGRTADPVYFNYLNLVGVAPRTGARLVVGGYHANARYIGEGHGSVMLGVDVPFAHRRGHLIVDWLTGNHPGSVAVLGGSFNPTERFALSLGYQPASSHNGAAGVVELTFNAGHRGGAAHGTHGAPETLLHHTGPLP